MNINVINPAQEPGWPATGRQDPERLADLINIAEYIDRKRSRLARRAAVEPLSPQEQAMSNVLEQIAGKIRVKIRRAVLETGS